MVLLFIYIFALSKKASPPDMLTRRPTVFILKKLT